MDSFIQADIFFFISSVGFTVIFAGLVVLVIYAFRIISDVREISKKIREESDAIIDDVRSVRQEIMAKKGKIATFLAGLLLYKNMSKKRKAKKEKED